MDIVWHLKDKSVWTDPGTILSVRTPRVDSDTLEFKDDYSFSLLWGVPLVSPTTHTHIYSHGAAITQAIISHPPASAPVSPVCSRFVFVLRVPAEFLSVQHNKITD